VKEIARRKQQNSIIREFEFHCSFLAAGRTFSVTPDGERFHESIRDRDIGSRQILSHHVHVTPDEYEIRRLWYTHKTQHEEAGYQETTSGETTEPCKPVGALQRARPDTDEAQIETIPPDREIQVYEDRTCVKKQREKVNDKLLQRGLRSDLMIHVIAIRQVILCLLIKLLLKRTLNIMRRWINI